MTTAPIGVLVLLAAITFLFGAWSEKRSAALMEAGDAYTACVEREYGRSPASYQAEHGYYPECATN